MAISSDYAMINGWYWHKDGTGPYIVDATGTPRIFGWATSLLSGEDQTLGRTFGGMAVEKYSLTGDGVPTGWIGPGRVTSIRCLTNGTIAGLYDNTSAAGTNLMVGQAMTANQVFSLASAGEAVYFDIGPFFDITGGTYIVFGIN